MAQTAASLASVLKDAWTSDVIQDQFYNQNPLLEMIQSAASETVIGLQAQVPIHSQRGAGYTTVGAGGGTLNPATNEATAQATYTLIYHYFQIAIEAAALNQSVTSAQSIISAKDLEMRGAVANMSKQASRQVARNGDGILAECATGGASTTVSLLPAASGGHGFDAIVRGHIYVGMPVDIGTTADTDSLVTGTTITAVGESPTAPTITIGSSISTVSGTHFVYWANPNSATAASPEMNGLENIIGTATFGGINPATAGNEYWQAYVDTTTTSFSIDMALDLQRRVFQKDGSYSSKVITSAKQMANFYSLLQNQVRFTGDRGLGAGGVGGLDGLTWNGTGVSVMPDVYDADWFHVQMDDLVKIHGNFKKPTWVSDIEGPGGDFRWTQGSTQFVNAVLWGLQLGAQRRNRMAAAKSLTA